MKYNIFLLTEIQYWLLIKTCLILILLIEIQCIVPTINDIFIEKKLNLYTRIREGGWPGGKRKWKESEKAANGIMMPPRKRKKKSEWFFLTVRSLPCLIKIECLLHPIPVSLPKLTNFNSPNQTLPIYNILSFVVKPKLPPHTSSLLLITHDMNYNHSFHTNFFFSWWKRSDSEASITHINAYFGAQLSPFFPPLFLSVTSEITYHMGVSVIWWNLFCFASTLFCYPSFSSSPNNSPFATNYSTNQRSLISHL